MTDATDSPGADRAAGEHAPGVPGPDVPRPDVPRLDVAGPDVPRPDVPAPTTHVADADAVTTAVLTASRLLVAVSVRSLNAVRAKVTVPQFRMLVVLATHGETKLITLAVDLGVNPSTAMRMAERLETAGLISRRVNPASRREILLRLTDAGREVVDEVTACRRDEIAAIVARMAPEQRVGLINALTAFTEAGGEPPVEISVHDAISLHWH